MAPKTISQKQFLQHCEDNNLEGVTDCLSRGVDVNTVSEYGFWSGLTIAAHKNYPELLEILLSHPDIKINNKSLVPGSDDFDPGSHRTVLMIACDRGNPAIVSRLVQVRWLNINYERQFQ